MRRWWQGTYVPWENDPRNSIMFIGGEYRRHWTAEVAHASCSYFIRNQMWLIPTVVAVIGIIVTAK